MFVNCHKKKHLLDICLHRVCQHLVNGKCANSHTLLGENFVYYDGNRKKLIERDK